MRKVIGTELTSEQLVNYYFGCTDATNDLNKIVYVIEETDMFRYSITENGDAIIAFPINIEYGDLPFYIPLKPQDFGNITLSDFFMKIFDYKENINFNNFIFYFYE